MSDIDWHAVQERLLQALPDPAFRSAIESLVISSDEELLDGAWEIWTELATPDWALNLLDSLADIPVLLDEIDQLKKNT